MIPRQSSGRVLDSPFSMTLTWGRGEVVSAARARTTPSASSAKHTNILTTDESEQHERRTPRWQHRSRRGGTDFTEGETRISRINTNSSQETESWFWSLVG